MEQQLDLPEIDQEKIEDIKNKSIDSVYNNHSLYMFIESNKISKEEVYKHLNPFIRALKSLEKCKNCPGLMKCDTHGFKEDLFKSNTRIYNELVKCDKAKELSHLKDKFVLSCIEDKAFCSSFNDLLLTFKEARTKCVFEFAKIIKGNDLSKGIYLYGDHGIGKSFIMQVFAKTLTSKLNKFACYIDARTEFHDLLLVPTWKKEDYFEEVELLSTIDVLFIDNLGEETLSDEKFADSGLVLTILKERQKNNLPTFITSTYSIKQLKEAYSKTKNGLKNSSEIIKILLDTTKEMKLESMSYPY